jgi:uncharacterized phiE125 gp8 family phage protein
MKKALKTAPLALPVSQAEAKAHLRIPELETGFDDYIDLLISVATAQAESFTGRRFVTQTWYGYLDNWPAGDRFELPFGRLQSVTSIKYQDSDEDEQTFSSSLYLVNTDSDPGFVCLAYQQDWPSATLSPSRPITVEFVCGYGLAAAVPENIKHAIKTRIADLFMNRENKVIGGGITVTTDLKVFESLLWPYKVFV